MKEIGEIFATLTVSSLMPIVIILAVISVLYLIYKQGGEFSTALQYNYHKTMYSFYHFIMFFNLYVLVVLLLNRHLLDRAFFITLYDIAKSRPIVSFGELLQNVRYIQFWIVGIVLLDILIIAIYFQTWRTPKANLRRSQRKELRQIYKTTWRTPDDDITVSGVIAGAPGSGKTAELLRIAEAKMKKKQAVVLIDGKGDIAEYSLYDGICKLARKHDRPLYVVNQTVSSDSDAYNPFAGCDATQVKDMMVSMGDWSSNALFYRDKASRYWQAMADYMIRNFIPLNFENLIYYSNPRELISHIMGNLELEDAEDKSISLELRNQIFDRFGERGLSRKRVTILKIILESAEGVEQNTASFATIYEGEGRRLFEGKDTFKIADAFDENAVVIVLLNSMTYGAFATGLGRLVIQDIKNALGEKMIQKETQQITAIFDEIGVYFDPELVDISARVRSIGGHAIYSMQGLSDLDVIDKTVRRQIVNTSNFFVAFKQNDPDDAVALADILGTDENVNTTSQVEDFGVAQAGTGTGTNKVTREYRFNPEVIKMLPKLRGIWFNKSNAFERPFIFKVKFIKIDGFEVPTKQQRFNRRKHSDWIM